MLVGIPVPRQEDIMRRSALVLGLLAVGGLSAWAVPGSIEVPVTLAADSGLASTMESGHDRSITQDPSFHADAQTQRPALNNASWEILVATRSP